MLFNSYIFILFFLPLCVVGYYLFNRFEKYKWGKLWLIAMSLWFYGYFNIHYLVLIVGSILANYFLYRILREDFRSFGKRIKDRYIMVFGVSANLGVLFYYKYYNFFIENVDFLFQQDFALQHVILPLGISFFTFQQVGFLVDAYRGETGNYSFTDYSIFVTFFPQLIAGPIVTHDEMIPQFQDAGKKKWNAENGAKGVYAFVCGLAKKVLIADIFGKAVTWGFADLAALNGLAALWMMLSYMVQLYFDFSGYSDMARGMGLMFNIDIPVNFNSPYKSLNLVDFWKRWHMTLNRFFTKYVYIPLGGSRKGAARTYFNIFMIYLVSGIWHGAGWTYIVWGAMHGCVYVLTKRFLNTVEKIPGVLSWLANSAFFLLSLVCFRAQSLSEANGILKKIVTGDYSLKGVPAGFVESFQTPEFFYMFKALGLEKAPLSQYYLMAGYMVAAWFMLLCCKNVNEKIESFKPDTGKAVFVAVLLLWSLISFSEVSIFLYFNF